jgi:hypothetical protein
MRGGVRLQPGRLHGLGPSLPSDMKTQSQLRPESRKQGTSSFC